METRPLSRLKRWRVISVLQKAVAAEGTAVTEADVAAAVPTKSKVAAEMALPSAKE